MADSSRILSKNRSWSPDINRNKEWKILMIKQHRRDFDTSFEYEVTDDDIKELTACFELGFGSDVNNELDPKLKRAFPALELYAAVNQQFKNRDLSRSSSSSDISLNSNVTSGLIVDPNDDPKKMKLRLKRWAQVVACSVREALKQPTIKDVE